MKIRFTLRNEDEQQDSKTKKYPIVLVVENTERGKEIRRKTATNEKVHFENWEKGSPKYVDHRTLKKNYPDVKPSHFLTQIEVGELHSRLLKIHADVSEIAKDPKLSVDEVMKRYKQKDATDFTSDSVESVLQQYIDKQKANRAKGSLNVYATVKTDLINYRSKGNEVSFAVLGEVEFFEKFGDYLLDEAGVQNSTLAKRMSVLRVLIKFAKDSKKISGISDSYLRYKGYPKTPADPIALRPEELKALSEIDLKNNPTHELIRDAFILNAAISLRRSDLHRLGPNHISDNVITLTSKKEDTRQVIPLTPNAIKILDKYQGKPQLFSDQESNRAIKEIAKLAGLNRQVETIERKRHNKSPEWKPLYEVITNHISRKTFATNMLALGIPSEIVEKAGGWAAGSPAFKRYIDIQNDRIVEAFQKAHKPLTTPKKKASRKAKTKL